MKTSKNDKVTSNEAIRLRVIEFAQEKFGTQRGWKVQFQKALGLSTIQQLSNILRGKNPISQKFVQKVVDLGANRLWLMAGIWIENSGNGKRNVVTIPYSTSIGYSLSKSIDHNSASATKVTVPTREPRIDISIIQDTKELFNRKIYDPCEIVNVTDSSDDSTYAIHIDEIDMENTFKMGDIVIVSKKRAIEKNKNVPVIIKLKNKSKHLVRFCTIQDKFYILSSVNFKIEPFVVKRNQIEYIHRITRSIRKY